MCVESYLSFILVFLQVPLMNIIIITTILVINSFHLILTFLKKLHFILIASRPSAFLSSLN